MSDFIIYTDGGATEHPDLKYYGGYGIYFENGEDKYRFYGATQYGDTNNLAEMLALRIAVEHCIEEGAKNVELYLDSQYVINGIKSWRFNWAKNGWKKRDGQPIENKLEWIKLIAVWEKFLATDVNWSMGWVRGHSGIYGNEMADDGATKGTALCLAGDFDMRKESLTGKELEAPVVEEKEKKKKAKVPNSPALLCTRRILNYTQRPTLRVGDAYAFMGTSFDDSADIPSRGCGIPSGESMVSFVVLKEKCDIIELVDERQNTLGKTSVEVPYLIFWDKVSGNKNWKEIHTDGAGAINVDHRGNLMSADKKQQYSHLMTVPRRSANVAEESLMLASIASDVFAGKETINKIDITDMIYDEGKKGKIAIKPELAKAKELIYNYTAKCGRTIKLILAFDYEIPNRNNFAKLAKQDKEVKVHLIIHDQTENTFRWSLMIETPEGYGMYANLATNLTILP